MINTTLRVIKQGGSLVIVLPRKLAEHKGIKSGDFLRVIIKKEV
jgi:antitoxin component of MazEF toxin-antitoxin module